MTPIALPPLPASPANGTRTMAGAPEAPPGPGAGATRFRDALSEARRPEARSQGASPPPNGGGAAAPAAEARAAPDGHADAAAEVAPETPAQDPSGAARRGGSDTRRPRATAPGHDTHKAGSAPVGTAPRPGTTGSRSMREALESADPTVRAAADAGERHRAAADPGLAGQSDPNASTLTAATSEQGQGQGPVQAPQGELAADLLHPGAEPDRGPAANAPTFALLPGAAPMPVPRTGEPRGGRAVEGVAASANSVGEIAPTLPGELARIATRETAEAGPAKGEVSAPGPLAAAEVPPVAAEVPRAAAEVPLVAARVPLARSEAVASRAVPKAGSEPGQWQSNDAQAIAPQPAASAAAAIAPITPLAPGVLGAVAPEAHIAAHPASASFAPQVGAHVTLFVRGGVEQARLQLNPADMGPVSVQIRLDGTIAIVNLSAEHALTRQSLEQAMPALAGQLREAGFTLGGGGVFERPPGQDGAAAFESRSRSDHGDSGRNGGNAGPGGNGSATAGSAALAAAPAAAWRARGLVDLVA